MNRLIRAIALCVPLLAVVETTRCVAFDQYIVEPAPLVPITPIAQPTPILVQPAPIVVQRPVVTPRTFVVQPAPVVVQRPVVVQPAPVLVQRPVVVARPIPVSQNAPGVVVQPSPVVVQRVPATGTVVTESVPSSHTVWYSAPAASVAPTLTTTPGVISSTTQYETVGSVTPSYVAPAPAPLVVGVAPTVVYRPVVSPVAIPSAYYIGSGLVGQPKVYVQGQPVRNALRYVSP